MTNNKRSAALDVPEDVIAFHADKIIVRGPQADGGFDVVLKVGEYEKHKLKKILDIPDKTTSAVVIKPLGGEDQL